MGSGGAQRAAVLDNTIAGLVALCPWLPNPQLNHQSPVLIFSGEDDTVTLPSQHANIHYNVTPNTTDKVLFEIANENRSFANTPECRDSSVGKIALSWLKLYVEENDCYYSLLTDSLLLNPPAASNLEQGFECESLGIDEHQLAIRFYPNPTKNIVNFEIRQDVNYKLISPSRQCVLKGNLTGNNKKNDLSQFPSSIYYLQIKGQIIKYN